LGVVMLLLLQLLLQVFCVLLLLLRYCSARLSELGFELAE